MKALHILRKPLADLAKQVMEKESGTAELTVLLIQDAVAVKESLPGRVIALEDDVRASGMDVDVPTIGYSEFVQLILENDKVICW